ncbi:MAG: SIS domain-containing protein [Phycisphaerae bacterium]|nr:SIS domain-containing protein [Phycisphaerae bacterium]
MVPDAPVNLNRAGTAARRIDAAIAAIGTLRSHAATIDRIAERMAERLVRGGTVYTAGNGGSAAEALHLAEELVGRYRSNRPPLRAVCLVADPTALSCIANDFGFDQVFARSCEAFLGPDDVLVLFSTSGSSANIVRAAEVGRRRGSLVIGLLGGSGGATLPQCDEAIVVAAGESAAIQEAHLVILHALCERFEA